MNTRSPTRSAPVGVLLAQLGTPDAPTPRALRRYLAEFLGDPRVVDLPRVLWWFILHGIILRVRPGKSAALYRRVWTEEGSPLLVYTRQQTEGVAARLEERHGDEIVTAFGMRYGNPSLGSAVEDLLARGCDRLLLVPLYPQYSVATTASVMDATLATVLDRYGVPALRVVAPYPDDPAYVDALAEDVRAAFAAAEHPPQKLLVSFHGEPESYRTRGDPYADQCRATFDALVHALGRDESDTLLVFQSRFGKAPWLQPYLDETLEELARDGVRDVAVVTPGFVADCLETIDEVGREAAESFREAGGRSLTRVPCLNAAPRWLDALSGIVARELSGWV